MSSATAPQAADPLWTLTDVAVHQRLHGVTLNIPAGRTVILGESGAGKSTLLELLSGFTSPTAGRIRGPSQVGWAPAVGSLWPGCTVREHLEAYSNNRKPAVADVLLNRFQLVKLADRSAATLSCGEASRLTVARAFAMPGTAVLLDEPFSHVDTALRPPLWDGVRAVLAEDTRSLLFATHDAESALAHAEWACCMAAGTVAWHGPVKTLYRTPPNAALMRLLGPGLWVEPPLANALGWPTLHAPCALRPWELEVRADATSPWTLLTTHDAGLFREVRLRHSAASIEITVPEATRPNAPTLGTGTRVRVTPLVATLLSALLLIIVAACEPQPAPKLKVRSWETFQLPAEGSSLPTARSLACARDGRLAALDTSGRVLVYSPSGLLLENWRMLDSSIGKPEGLVWMSDDTLMVCDTHYNRVVRFSGKGDLLGSFGRKGKGPGEFGYPVGIARDPQDRLYVCEYGGNDRVQRFDRNGTYLGSFGSFGVEPGQFQRPSGLVWADGKILVADAINNRVSIFTEDGTYIGVLGGKDPVPLRLPYDITTANLPGPLPGYFIIEYGACRLTLTDANGRVLGRLGSPGRNEFEFSTPWGVASDNTGTVYIADTLNRRIVKLRIDE